MSDYEPDPEFRTPWEREADEADEQQVAGLAALIEELDANQAARERIAFEDPVGATWFGEYPRAEDADKWWERRLPGELGK